MILPTEKIIKWRMDGVHPVEIASLLKVSKKRINRKLWKITKSKGIKFPRIAPEHFDLENLASAAKKYAIGKTLADVGKIYGVKGETIRMVFSRNGIKTRSRAQVNYSRRRKKCRRGHKARDEYFSSKPFRCGKCDTERAAGKYLKKYCPKGHPYFGKNLYARVDKKTGRKIRHCRECGREKTRIWRDKNLEKHRASCRNYQRKLRKLKK